MREIFSDFFGLDLTLTYDDVLIVPSRSAVPSRSSVSCATRFSRSIPMNVPVVTANMDTVCEDAMAIAMARIGGIGVLHRFASVEDQARMVEETKKADPLPTSAGWNLVPTVDDQGCLRVAAAVGVGADMLARAESLCDAGVDALVIDIAHGHAQHVFDALLLLKDRFDIDVVAGNVATPQGVLDLAGAGADAVKVGVGPGSVCTTRITAGVGVPQLTAVLAAVEALDSISSDVPVIADGGIRLAGGVSKAMAAGAHCVMLGSLLAGTDESPGEVVKYRTPSGGVELKKAYRGMASLGAQVERASSTPSPVGTPDTNIFDLVVPEGVTATVDCKGPVSSIVHQLIGGLRNGMNYVGAMELSEFKSNARFVKITPLGIGESHPHALS